MEQDKKKISVTTIVFFILAVLPITVLNDNTVLFFGVLIPIFYFTHLYFLAKLQKEEQSKKKLFLSIVYLDLIFILQYYFGSNIEFIMTLIIPGILLFNLISFLLFKYCLNLYQKNILTSDSSGINNSLPKLKPILITNVAIIALIIGTIFLGYFMVAVLWILSGTGN